MFQVTLEMKLSARVIFEPVAAVLLGKKLTTQRRCANSIPLIGNFGDHIDLFSFQGSKGVGIVIDNLKAV